MFIAELGGLTRAIPTREGTVGTGSVIVEAWATLAELILDTFKLMLVFLAVLLSLFVDIAWIILLLIGVVGVFGSMPEAAMSAGPGPDRVRGSRWTAVPAATMPETRPATVSTDTHSPLQGGM